MKGDEIALDDRNFAILHGCSATPIAPTSSWFAGTWLAQPDGERDLSACVGGVAVNYFPDGSFSHWEWSGVEVKARGTDEAADWSLDAWRLRRVAVAAERLAPRYMRDGDDVRIDAMFIVPKRFPRHLPNVRQG